MVPAPSPLLPFAFYGTLLEGLPAKPGRPAFEDLGCYLGPCLIPGLLEDYGPYPRLTQGYGTVKGQLWLGHGEEAVALLDDWEMGDPADPGGAQCERRRMLLRHPRVQAWVYVYAPTPGAVPIISGDWAALPKAHDIAQLLALADTT